MVLFDDMTNFLGKYKTNPFTTNIKPLATCPSAAKTVGDPITITVNILSGTPPYTIQYQKNGVTISTAQTSSTINTYIYTTTSTDIGTQSFGVIVTDSCITPIPFTDSCPVTVNAAPIITSVVLSGCNSPIGTTPPNNTCQLTVTCLDQFSNPMTCPELIWATDNGSIAIPDSNGLVTGYLQGTALISANYIGPGGIYGTKLVTVLSSCITPTCTLTLS